MGSAWNRLLGALFGIVMASLWPTTRFAAAGFGLIELIIGGAKNQTSEIGHAPMVTAGGKALRGGDRLRRSWHTGMSALMVDQLIQDILIIVMILIDCLLAS